MKRITTLVLALIMALSCVLGFSSCNTEESSDWGTIQDRGFFTCGITVYSPMNYFDEDDNLTGFDTEFAEAVAEYLGVEAKFQIIKWPNKYLELNSGSIDLIWNGFTYGDEDGISRTEYVDFTYSYLENRQCIVTKSTDLESLNSKEAFADKRGVAEGGSSGQSVAEELAGSEDKVTTFDSQVSALTELVSGTADFAVIDYQMARAMVGQGSFASLSINTAYEPESEVYAIGCRKGSDLTAKINEAILALSENGTLAALAEKYGLTNDLISDIGNK